ncbi:RNA ligase family protein [Candidatus Uabimicrobium sp. HlEnr_7]|uniref:RNA ligase family protein n=1 Tax=Candidatus Uabimicrobium helgolandensis TaxID=3095367 RepID=UPI003556ECF0
MTIKENFVGYEKIFSNSNKWVITEKDYRDWKKIEWVVTEKVHGANFCILVDGENIHSAKRKSILEPGESFFHYQKIIAQYKENILELFHAIKLEKPLIEGIYVYGELFGGQYPHSNVKSLGLSPIQTGVYYSPDVEFLIFDIAYVAEGKRKYIDYCSLVEKCRSVDMPYSQSLYKGAYDKAMAFEHKFITTIPEILGLPKIEDNYAEGIVIKPATHITVKTKKGNKIRPITKKKIEEFSEIKYNEAKKWCPQKNNYFDLACLYITKNRLRNVLSKMGDIHISSEQRKKVLDSFVVDVLEEMQNDYSDVDITETENLIEKVSAQVKDFLDKEL